jgi:hypothetical protein
MASQQVSAKTQESKETREVNIVDVDITNENVALNVMVALLNMAQRRGVYTMQESAKAWQCIQKFMRPASEGTDSEQKNVTMDVSEAK